MIGPYKTARLTNNLIFKGLWMAVLGGAVLGRLIDKVDLVEESNPGFLKEQAREWRSQFFLQPGTTSVRLEELSGSSGDEVEHRLSGSSRVGRRTAGMHFEPGRGFEPSYYPTAGSAPSGHNNRINTRHLNVDQISYIPPWGPQIRRENLEWMLQNIFTYPRSHVTNETAKEIVRKYISDSFQITSGISTSIQYFNPIQFLSLYEGTQIPVGANIIGILTGREYSKPTDRPIVVGAHWDTVNFTPGTDDNGSGVASMLEIARAISQSGCRPRYSIIFVAFDLEEVGSQGSLVFIKNYLMKILRTSFPTHSGGMAHFQGAFILDTIMNFNDTFMSQSFPTELSLVLPQIYDQLADEGFKGDFLSLIYRKGIDQRLSDKFKEHWDRRSRGGQVPLSQTKFRLKPFPLGLSADLPDLEVLADHLNFLRSDHARFWYMNDTEIPATFPAVLMTDTGPFRGNMRSCYHSICDSPEVSVYRKPNNIDFLLKISQTLADTLVDLSECSLDGGNGFESRSFGSVSSRSTGSTAADSPLAALLNFVKWMQNFQSKNPK